MSFAPWRIILMPFPVELAHNLGDNSLQDLVRPTDILGCRM
jgi:hypothetical protein